MTCTDDVLQDSATAVALRPDPALLEELYHQHGGALRALCRKRLSNDRDAEDACQEALLRAWSALDRFDPARPMWPWLATIAGNVCIDMQRRARTVETRRLPRDPEPMSPEEVAVDGDRTLLVREALGQLPSASQRVLFLRDVEGWSYGRISRHEGRSAPAIRTAVTRARHQLRTQVEAAAKAAGRWPLPAAIGVLWARGRRRARRARAGTTEVVTRSISVVDSSTGLATTFGSSVAAQVVCSALLMVAAAGIGAATAPAHPPTVAGASVISSWSDATDPTGAHRAASGGAAVVPPGADGLRALVAPGGTAEPALPVPDVAVAPALVVPDVQGVTGDAAEAPTLTMPAPSTTLPTEVGLPSADLEAVDPATTVPTDPDLSLADATATDLTGLDTTDLDPTAVDSTVLDPTTLVSTGL